MSSMCKVAIYLKNQNYTKYWHDNLNFKTNSRRGLAVFKTLTKKCLGRESNTVYDGEKDIVSFNECFSQVLMINVLS